MMMQKKTCIYVYLGEVKYQSAWNLQKRLLELRRRAETLDVLLLLQHPPTITLGKSGSRDHLLADADYLESRGFELTETDRGGDITYHGPGQLVAYPILDLAEIRKDIFWYLRQLEQVIMNTLACFSIATNRRDGYTGVWAGDKKIAAIGVKVSRWITLHGIALNVSPDLQHFDFIVPCGIRDKSVTSIAKTSGGQVEVEEVVPHFVQEFGNVFGYRMMPFNHDTWPVLTRTLDDCVGELLKTNIDLKEESVLGVR
jgi:lipoate-protein ligase B